MTHSMIETFTAARNVSVPILVVRTADQNATVTELRNASAAAPFVLWDAVRGLTALPKSDGARALLDFGEALADSVSFVAAMDMVTRMPKGTVTVALNAHRQLASSEPGATATAVQALANLRDVLKLNSRMLVLLAPQFTAPIELAQDVVIVDDPLPGSEALGVIVKELHDAAKLPAPTAEVVGRAVDAVSGLSAFAAEQVTAMSLTAGGLDVEQLWDRKRTMIEQTRGLSVWRGKESFAGLRGLTNIKARLNRRLSAKTPVGVVVFVDEIDKVLANVESDTTGVRMDQLRTLLTEMENNRWHGLVAVGVPGAGKSAIAKAFGNEAGVPTIALDLGGMEGGLVGESEQNLRQAISVIKAVGRGNAFFIATSNNASVMRPEMQRRFTKGTFFFDLPSEEERAEIWALYCERLGVAPEGIPSDDGWTGAEIRNCVEEAADTGVSLVEAATGIVPAARSRAREIDELRQYAHGRFLDANHPGTFSYTGKAMEQFLRDIKLPTEKEKVN